MLRRTYPDRKMTAGTARIAVVTSHAPSLRNFRGELLAAFLDQGHEVIALAPDFDASTRAPLTAMGVRCEPIGLARTGVNPFRDLADLAGLARALRRLRPDIVLSYSIKPVIHGSLAARIAGVGGVYAIIAGLGYTFAGSSIYRVLLRALVERLYRTALKTNRAVFFQNPDDLALFRDRSLLGTTRAVLINGSGVNLERFREAPPRPSPPVFLLMARLLKAKGIVEYAQAARLLKARHSEARFHLLGPSDPNPDGIPASQVERWASEGTIVYLGAVEDVRPFLNEASVYVLPSYYREGIPRSVLEAMAAGRPIVTTDAPGCRETVVDGANGFLVPPRDVAALAGAMERFILEPNLIPSMGRASRRLAEEKYDVHKVNAVILRAMGLSDEARH